MSYLSWSDVRRWPPPLLRERRERLLGLASGAGAVLASAVFLSAIDGVLSPAAREPAASPSRVAGFEVNRGQAEAAVRFLSRADGFVLSLAATEARLRPACPRQQCAPIRLRLVGAGAGARLVAQQPLPGSTYASVLYEEIYPGVGLRFIGHGGELSYAFLVDRGASPQSIVLELDGVDRVLLDAAGALSAEGVSGARLMLPAPAAWQLVGKQRVAVEARYTLQGRQVGIETGPYDVRRPLEISGGRGRLVDPHAPAD